MLNMEIDQEKHNGNETAKESPPSDKFYLIYILFLVLGLTSVMSSQYIFSANDVSIIIDINIFLYYRFRVPGYNT